MLALPSKSSLYLFSFSCRNNDLVKIFLLIHSFIHFYSDIIYFNVFFLHNQAIWMVLYCSSFPFTSIGHNKLVCSHLHITKLIRFGIMLVWLFYIDIILYSFQPEWFKPFRRSYSFRQNYLRVEPTPMNQWTNLEKKLWNRIVTYYFDVRSYENVIVGSITNKKSLSIRTNQSMFCISSVTTNKPLSSYH